MKEYYELRNMPDAEVQKPSTCPLLNLPRQLRDIISTHALSLPYGVEVPLRREESRGKPVKPLHCLGLTQTCRQLRDETQELFFSLNESRFERPLFQELQARAYTEDLDPWQIAEELAPLEHGVNALLEALPGVRKVKSLFDDDEIDYDGDIWTTRHRIMFEEVTPRVAHPGVETWLAYTTWLCDESADDYEAEVALKYRLEGDGRPVMEDVRQSLQEALTANENFGDGFAEEIREVFDPVLRASDYDFDIVFGKWTIARDVLLSRDTATAIMTSALPGWTTLPLTTHSRKCLWGHQHARSGQEGVLEATSVASRYLYSPRALPLDTCMDKGLCFTHLALYADC